MRPHTDTEYTSQKCEVVLKVPMKEKKQKYLN
jgi:hypothetical protein